MAVNIPVQKTADPKQEKAPTDLKVHLLGRLPWDETDREASLHAVYDHVTLRASEAAQWYLDGKRWKKRFARIFRGAIILLVAAAGIHPLIVQMVPEGATFNPVQWVLLQPVWSAILLAMAGLLLAYDQFFGFSSAWVRYVRASQRIHGMVDRFEMDWSIARNAWRARPVTQAEAAAMLQRARTFIESVGNVVQEETDQWSREFQASLKQVEEALKTERTRLESGALQVRVENGDQCQGGWTLSIEGVEDRHCQGKTAAVSNLPAGSRTVRVRGTLPAKEGHAEAIAHIPTGGVAQVTLTVE